MLKIYFTYSKKYHNNALKVESKIKTLLFGLDDMYTIIKHVESNPLDKQHVFSDIQRINSCDVFLVFCPESDISVMARLTTYKNSNKNRPAIGINCVDNAWMNYYLDVNAINLDSLDVTGKILKSLILEHIAI